MARPKNINATLELKIPITDQFKFALAAYAKISAYSTPNDAALDLIRQGLEGRFGKFGSQDFLRTCNRALDENEEGQNNLMKKLNIQIEEDET